MIGLDISQRSIKMVHLSHTNPRKVLGYCWHEVPAGVIQAGIVKDIELLQKIIGVAFSKCSLVPGPKYPIVASVPETESFLRVMDLPPMEEQEIGEAVQWEVASHIPFGIENVYIDWQPVALNDKKDPRQEVLVGAAEKKVIDPLYKTLSTMKLDVAAFELESQALIRSLVSPELQKRKGLLLVDIGEEATNVVIHDAGTTRFTASLQKGASELLLPLSAEEAKHVTGPPHDNGKDAAALADKLQAGCEGLAEEVKGIVEFYTGLNTEHKVNEILLTGGGSNLPGLDAAVIKYFENVHVHRGNPWVNILPPGKDTRPPMSLQESVHFATALGLALRDIIS